MMTTKNFFVPHLYIHNQTIVCDFGRITNSEIFNYISKNDVTKLLAIIT